MISLIDKPRISANALFAETILKSLLRLFSILAQSLDNSKIESTRGIIESYLRQLVNPDKINQYMMMYDFYYKGLKEKVKFVANKRHSLYSFLLSNAIVKSL